MHGFYNKILEIDVAEKSFEINPISDQLLRKTLGGKGLGTYLLLKENPPLVDPLSPDNRLIITTGPIAGTPVWGSCRYGVFTKSPQTGFYSESYAGGTAAEYMAKTGFDVFLMKGASEEPVWIEINEDGAVFHSADDLWGLDTYETEDRVKAWIKENRPEAKKSGVIVIGPAGENQVAFSVIENDYWRSAGRTGVGTVMGSKKVKAIACWGNQKRELADPDLIKNFAKNTSAKAKGLPGINAYKTKGTPMMVDIMSKVGSFPSRYWHKGQSEHREKINAKAFHEHLDVKPSACMKCFIACGRMSTVKEGRHKGMKMEGPEYETIFAFGGLCDIDSIEEITYLNDICDRLGIDTITAGNLVGLTIEASRQGKIDYDIDYGEVDKMAELLKDIVYRRGIGEALARGIKVAAKEFDMEDQAIHVKGMEPAGYDPRVLKGMGLAYGTSDRGACHLRATYFRPELSNIIDPDQIEGKSDLFVIWEDRVTFFDTLILCRFYRDLYEWPSLSEMVKGITGLDLSEDEMISIAADVADNTRRFNIREGLTPSDDKLPKRFHTEVLPETGKIITEEQMDQLLKDYYKARGWDEQGVPPESGE